jgi:hypothetical protein
VSGRTVSDGHYAWDDAARPDAAGACDTPETLYEEIVAVLAISLLASAAYAIVSLLTAP